LDGKKIISLLASAGLLMIVFYEISLPLEFASVETIQMPDPDTEAAFARCYAEKDREMHEAVFGAIDNPDVQKEMISTNRDLIAGECRQRFPDQLITVERDIPSNLIELKPRFW
jgi:hypothetical protein